MAAFHPIPSTMWQGKEALSFHTLKQSKTEQDVTKNVLRKKSGRIHWAPPGEASGTTGTQDVGTYVITPVASKGESCPSIVFHFTNLSCLMWYKSICQPTPLDWFLPPSTFSCPFLSFLSPRAYWSHWYPSLGKTQTCFGNICNHAINCINIIC